MHLVLSLRLHRGMTHRLHHHYCGGARKPSRTASIYPSVAEINALPEKFRQYIHDLETRCDKICDVQTIALLREDGMRCSVAWKSWRPSWIGSAESFSLCGQTSPQSVAATRVTIVR